MLPGYVASDCVKIKTVYLNAVVYAGVSPGVAIQSVTVLSSVMKPCLPIVAHHHRRPAWLNFETQLKIYTWPATSIHQHP